MGVPMSGVVSRSPPSIAPNKRRARVYASPTPRHHRRFRRLGLGSQYLIKGKVVRCVCQAGDGPAVMATFAWRVRRGGARRNRSESCTKHTPEACRWLCKARRPLVYAVLLLPLGRKADSSVQEGLRGAQLPQYRLDDEGHSDCRHRYRWAGVQGGQTQHSRR